MRAMGAPRHRTPLLVLTAVVLVSGVLAALDFRNATYTGYLTDGDRTIIQVADGSPAAAAGMQEGDRLVSIGGIAVSDMRGLSRQARAAAGEVRTIEIDRAGQTVPLQLEYASMPAREALAYRLATLLGLAFIGFGLWAYFAAPGPATAVLAYFGVSFGFAFVGVPYFQAPAMRALVDATITAAILIGFALLLHFLLLYPRRRALLDRPSGLRFVYAPAIAVALFFVALTVLQPDATSGLNVFVRTLIGLFIAGYFVTSLVVLYRGYAAADARVRKENGLALMLAGAVLGLGPLIVSSVVGLLSPTTVLPGSRFYFLALALIPVTFAIAAVRGARASSVPVAAGVS